MLDALIPRPPDWRFGPRRRWHLPSTLEVGLNALAPADHNDADVGDMRASAVLVPIAPIDGEASVLLTKRSAALRHHPGEISFPGGRIDPGEYALVAAQREASEEVGLDSGEITVRGQLRHHRTAVSNSHIVPIVAEVHPDAELTLNPAEVDHAFWVRLADLAAPDVYHCEIWSRDRQVHIVHFFALPASTGLAADEVLWGATARMLVDLLDLLASARYERK